MRIASSPALDRRYWLSISIASVTGANLGDFVSHDLGFGHLRGVPLLALLFGLVLRLERRARRGGTGFYWAAILLLRTGATNIADLLTHDLRCPPLACIAALGLLLLGLVGRGGPRAPDPPALPRTTSSYWGAMFVAGTLGTVIGDWVAGPLGLGLPAGTAILAIPVAVLLARRGAAGIGRNGYWGAIVSVRSAGTCAGDFLADAVFGLPLSTAVTGASLLLAVRAPAPGPVRRRRDSG